MCGEVEESVCVLQRVMTIMIRVSAQSLQLLASQINTVDLSQLDQTALKSIQLLQVCGAHLLQRRWLTATSTYDFQPLSLRQNHLTTLCGKAE